VWARLGEKMKKGGEKMKVKVDEAGKMWDGFRLQLSGIEFKLF
jgi:hypothetical protein